MVVKVGAKYLVQGTIAPDWIESGGGVRDTIQESSQRWRTVMFP